MVSKLKVLILGAGASMPYGYPSGKELKITICHELTVHKDSRLRRILLELGHPDKRVTEFAQALRGSGKPSVDAFLEHRTEFSDVGKAAIAGELIGHEHEHKLVHDELGGEGEDQWYEYLYNKLGGSFAEFFQNKLSVITFNYDRSLEYYLFTALKNDYNEPDGECRRAIEQLSIVHVHGKLGYLPWQSDDGRPYEPTEEPDLIGEAAKGIRIVHEGAKEDEELVRAKKIIRDAKVICFLGFGYLKDNIERISPGSIGQDVLVLGTTCGLCLAEQDHTTNLVSTILREGDSLNTRLSQVGEGILKYLRNASVLE